MAVEAAKLPPVAFLPYNYGDGYSTYTNNNATSFTGVSDGADQSGGGGAIVASVVRRWEREDLLEKRFLQLRSAAAIFSFISLVLMASNRHGDWMDFDRYQEYRYILAVSALAFAYALLQVVRQASRLAGWFDSLLPDAFIFLDFAGDQVTSYLLISALSAASPITNRMRTAVVNTFTNVVAASIGMAFFAFLALALSSGISGFKLAKQINAI